jgi:hypothetical protein
MKPKLVIQLGIVLVILDGILGTAILHGTVSQAFWWVVGAGGLLALGVLVSGAFAFGATSAGAEQRTSSDSEG